MQVGIKIGDVMTRSFVSVRPKTSIQDAVKLMVSKKISSLVIKEGQGIRGMLTEGDIIEAVAKKINLKSPVKKIMSKHVVTISPSKDVSLAFSIMRKRKIRWLPVTINQKILGLNKKVVGLLTMKDILKVQPALFDIASQRFKVAEEKEKQHRVRTVNNQRWVREGPCHECGVYDLLYKSEDRYLCENCKKKTGN